MTKMRRIAALITALILAVSMMPSVAFAAPKAQAVELDVTSITLDISGVNRQQLEAVVLPAGAPQNVVWGTSNKNIATVSTTGIITAKGYGIVTIGARPKGVNKWTKVKVTVTDSKRPTSVTLPQATITIAKGEKFQLAPTYLPEGSGEESYFGTRNSSVASVSSTGVVTGRAIGTTVVGVRSRRNTGLTKTMTVRVVNAQTPTSIVMTPGTNSLVVGEKLQLTADVKPDTASDAVTWKTSNAAIATVSATGVVTAHKPGNVKIGAISKVKSSVTIVRSFSVSDPNAPTGIKFSSSYGDQLFMIKGESTTLEYSVQPSGARKDATFTSTNSKIVEVDESTGKITCRASGVVGITVTAKGSTTITDVIRVTVTNPERVTVIPARTTADDANAIKENLAKIDAIEASVYNELKTQIAKKKMSVAEAETRWAAISKAFKSYAFAWKTDKQVTYWNSALSATNDFKPGRMYYGMSYIQNGANQNYANRQFLLDRAVSEGYFKGSSRIYEMTDKRLNKYYVGCDCSSFVSMAIWGLGHSAATLNTVGIASSKYYTTIADKKALKPGDILNKSGSHVIMFLYYTDDNDKSQMMLIEQGGNTVTCNVANVSKYASYTAKRPLKFG